MMDCVDARGERRHESCSSEGRQKQGREACSEYRKGEGRGFEVQLAAVVTVCVFPSMGFCLLCATHWQPCSSHPQRRAGWPLHRVLQLQLSAGSQALVVHPHGSCTLLV